MLLYFLILLSCVITLIYFENCKQCTIYNTSNLIRRKDWGASNINNRTSEESGYYNEKYNPSGLLYYKFPLKGKFISVVIHHSALPLGQSVKYIQNLHMKKQLFADIGYHFVIDAKGKVFEGREINIRGAHVKGNNTGTIGVALLGNFQYDTPTDCQINSLVNLLVHLKKKYDVKDVTTHICFNPLGTVCPGKNLISLIPAIAKRSNMNYLN